MFFFSLKYGWPLLFHPANFDSERRVVIGASIEKWKVTYSGISTTPETVNECSWLSTKVLPNAGLSPKYFSAVFFERTIEFGSFSAFSGEPSVNGYRII